MEIEVNGERGHGREDIHVATHDLKKHEVRKWLRGSGADMQDVIKDVSSLRAARDQANKETERGKHRPAVGGFTDHKHGGES